MPTVSHVTQKLVKENLLLVDYLTQGIINYAALAEKLTPKVSEELDKSVKQSAVIMALRRYGEKLQKQESKYTKLQDCELILKSGLCVITVTKSPSVFQILNKMNKIIDFEKGDIFNIIHGNSDVSIIINERYKNKLVSLFEHEKILNKEIRLVGLTVRFGIDQLHTPGITYTFLRALAIENINLIEIVSSTVETTFIISEKNAVRAYAALSEIIK